MARNFNGSSDQIDFVSQYSDVITASAASISVWLRPTGSSPVTTVAYDGRAALSDGGRYLGIFQATIGGLDRLWVYNYDGNEDRVGVTYTLGAWVNIILIHSGGTLFAYKDGALVSSVASGNTQVVSSTPHWGGTDGNSAYWQGDIAETAIWNTALFPGEISHLGRGTSPFSLRWGANLTWYAPFWGLHTAEPDFSPNRRTATLRGTRSVPHPPRALAATHLGRSTFGGAGLSRANSRRLLLGVGR